MNRAEIEKELADLKRANKARKLHLAMRKGYDTVLEYREALETILSVLPRETIVKKKKPKKATKKKVKEITKPKIHIAYLLDNSASMKGSKFNNALKGIKDELKDLEKDTSVEYKTTFSCFKQNGLWGADPLICWINKPLEQILPKLSANTGTPLYDTIIEVGNHLISKKEKDVKILFKIFTDGKDVHSKDSANHAAKVIEDCEKEGITVTFVGTKEDVKDIIKNLSIDESNTLVHDNTGEGVKKAFETTSRATKMYSKKVIKGEDVLTGFYKEEATL